jgi:Mn2+/Fe2+ NRAMP family transporter
MVIATGVVFMPIDPIKLLFWAAVINGAISVPIMGVMMVLAHRHRQMGAYVANRWQLIFGWAATLAMALAVVTMFVFS